MKGFLPPAVLILGVGAAIWIGVAAWNMAGGGVISGQGWLALGLGGVLTVGLGIALMFLIFFSSRRGYDARASGEDAPE